MANIGGPASPTYPTTDNGYKEKVDDEQLINLIEGRCSELRW